MVEWKRWLLFQGPSGTLTFILLHIQFYRSSAFNGDWDYWDISNLETALNMFCGAELFNRDISRWNVSKLTDMRSMFESAVSFNQDLCSWGNMLPHMGTMIEFTFESTACLTWADPVTVTGGPYCAVCPVSAVAGAMFSAPDSLPDSPIMAPSISTESLPTVSPSQALIPTSAPTYEPTPEPTFESTLYTITRALYSPAGMHWLIQ